MSKLFRTKKILNIIIGIVTIIVSLVLFIQSYQKYADESGTDISFNNDYVITLLLGIVIMVYGIITLKEDNAVYYNISGMIMGFLPGAYSLGVFLKALNKAILDTKVKFDFAGHQLYLYIGIIGLLVFVFYLCGYLDNKKSN